MGSWFSGSLTGEGSHDLGAFVVLNDMYYIVESISSTRVRQLGTTPPIRVLYGGIVGGSFLGTGPGGVPNYPTVGFWFKIEWLEEDPSNDHQDVWMGCDHVFWKLPPGLTLALGVSW